MTERRNEWKTSHSDLEILRGLARRTLEIANDPVNAERRRLWYAHDEGRAERPMVLCESGVAYGEMPEHNRLRSEAEWARGLENGLRFEIFQFEQIRDDHVVEPYVNCNWKLEVSDYGVQARQEYAPRVSGNVSSRRWEHPIKDINADFDKLHPRAYSVDRDGTLAWKAHLEEVFDGVLPVRIRGGFWWTVGMTWAAIDLIGLENLMLYMCTEPEGLHRLMAFLRDDHIAFIEWFEREGLLTLNNENDYIGSGSMGYSRRLPAPDKEDDEPARLRDIWGLSESQETALVGPDQFEEFVFRYQLPVIEKFGAIYYGCCEPVHNRWNSLKKIPNLRRVSVAPWCDQEFMADALGRDIVFSRKPNPTLISTEHFDEDLIREDLCETCRIARDCNLELIMKDVHTLCGEPQRAARWVQIAREAIDETT